MHSYQTRKAYIPQNSQDTPASLDNLIDSYRHLLDTVETLTRPLHPSELHVQSRETVLVDAHRVDRKGPPDLITSPLNHLSAQGMCHSRVFRL